MDLVEFLQKLTDKDVDLSGVHPEYGVYYDLKLCELRGALSGKRKYLQVAWTTEPRAFGGRRGPCNAYSSLDIRGMTMFEEVHTAAMAMISENMAWCTNLKPPVPAGDS